MQKGDPTAMRAGYRSVVDQAKAFCLQPREMLVEIRDPQADVVDAFAALGHESTDRGIIGEWLEKLETRIADRQKSSPHALRLDRLDVIDAQAEGLVDLRRIEGTDSDADVIERRLFHHTPRASAPQ